MGNWITSEGVTHSVNGRPLTFYPVTLKGMLKLKGVAAPVAKSIAVLFGGFSDQNNGVSERATPGGAVERTIEAVDPALAKVRSDQREKAVAELLEAVLDEKFALALGTLILDSLRGGIEEKQPDFLLSCDASSVRAFLVGLALANKDLLTPFAGVLARAGVKQTQPATAGTT